MEAATAKLTIVPETRERLMPIARCVKLFMPRLSREAAKKACFRWARRGLDAGTPGFERRGKRLFVSTRVQFNNDTIGNILKRPAYEPRRPLLPVMKRPRPRNILRDLRWAAATESAYSKLVADAGGEKPLEQLLRALSEAQRRIVWKRLRCWREYHAWAAGRQRNGRSAGVWRFASKTIQGKCYAGSGMQPRTVKKWIDAATADGLMVLFADARGRGGGRRTQLVGWLRECYVELAGKIGRHAAWRRCTAIAALAGRHFPSRQFCEAHIETEASQ